MCFRLLFGVAFRFSLLVILLCGLFGTAGLRHLLRREDQGGGGQAHRLGSEPGGQGVAGGGGECQVSNEGGRGEQEGFCGLEGRPAIPVHTAYVLQIRSHLFIFCTSEYNNPVSSSFKLPRGNEERIGTSG